MRWIAELFLLGYNILFGYDCFMEAGSLLGIYTAEAPHVEFSESWDVQSSVRMSV